jgi:sulfur carrier protein
MKLTLNGQVREFAEGLDGAGLLQLLGLPAATMVAEVNGLVLMSSEFQAAALGEGDVIELVTVVGGG